MFESYDFYTPSNNLNEEMEPNFAKLLAREPIVERDTFGNIKHLVYAEDMKFSFTFPNFLFITVPDTSLILTTSGSVPSDEQDYYTHAYNTEDYKCWEYVDNSWVELDHIYCEENSSVPVSMHLGQKEVRMVVKDFRGSVIQEIDGAVFNPDTFEKPLAQGTYTLMVILTNNEGIESSYKVQVSCVGAHKLFRSIDMSKAQRLHSTQASKGKALIVTLSKETATANHSSAEIYSCTRDGWYVLLIDNGEIFPLSSCSADVAVFGGITKDYKNNWLYEIHADSSYSKYNMQYASYDAMEEGDSNLQSEIELRSQGRSARYTLTSSGWKRVLNIIRATNGTLQLGVAKATGGIHAVQALGINFTGNVNFKSVGIDTEPVIYQVYDHEFGDNNSDDTTRHARITQVRIGYSKGGTEFPDSDGSVNYKTNPVNCYVDVYVDFNADSGNAQLNMNFAGFADSHNCTPITEETDAQDTGMYGETLQYKTFTVSKESTVYMPDGSITANKVHAGNMPYELLESTNENPVILRNLPNGIYYITGNGYYYEGKATAFTKGLYIVKRLSSQSDIVRLCPETTVMRYYTITDNSYTHTNNTIDFSKIADNTEKITEMANRVETLSDWVNRNEERIEDLIASALHPEVKTEDMTQPVGVGENGTLWTAPAVGGEIGRPGTGDGAEIFNNYANNEASGVYSHAEGNYTRATGYSSHAEGWNAIASGQYQHAQGKNNIEDTESIYAHIVGNGESENSRSNAHTIDWIGNAWFAGNVYAGAMNEDGTYNNASKLITQEQLDTVIGNIESTTDRIINIQNELIGGNA